MNDEEKKLEAWVGAKLGALPERRAPSELMERVWQAVREREERPWWRRGWATWPRWAQTTCGLLSSALVCGLAMFAPLWGWGGFLEWFNGVATDVMTKVFRPLEVWWVGVKAMGLAASSLVQSVSPIGWWAMGLGLVVVGVLYGCFLGMGLALYRGVRRPIQ